MTYRLTDFIYNLEQQGMGLLDIQSDWALELIRECLPRNLTVKRFSPEELTSREIALLHRCVEHSLTHIEEIEDITDEHIRDELEALKLKLKK